jgi:hypothetical protein
MSPALALGLGLGLTPAKAAPSGPAVRVVPDTANSFYVMGRSARGTAFAYHFIRNVGGNSATDQGGSWPNWRYVGNAEFASMSAAPASDAPLRAFSNDTGAQDYAFVLPTSAAKFSGSYHGVGASGSLNAETLKIDGVNFDPTSSTATGSQIVMTHGVTISDGTSTVTVAGFTVTIDATGINFNSGTISSTAVLATAYVGMSIATGAFDEATFTLVSGDVEYKVPVSTGTKTYGRTFLQKANMVSLRKTSDGLTVRLATNAPTVSNYRRTSMVRDGVINRTKIYCDVGNSAGAFGSVSGIAWSQAYELGAAGFSTLAANLITNGAFNADITGWTTNQNPSGVAWNTGGFLRMTRGASGTDTRTIQAVTTVVGAVYLLSAENTYTPSVAATYLNPGSLGLTNNSNGSTSSPAPAYTPISFDQDGYNAHVVIPTATTQYAMMLLPADSASGNDTTADTSDFDNVTLYRLTTTADAAPPALLDDNFSGDGAVSGRTPDVSGPAWGTSGQDFASVDTSGGEMYQSAGTAAGFGISATAGSIGEIGCDFRLSETVNAMVVTGTPGNGDLLIAQVYPSGSPTYRQIIYAATASDTLATATAAFAALITADVGLAAAGISAGASGGTVTVTGPLPPRLVCLGTGGLTVTNKPSAAPVLINYPTGTDFAQTMLHFRLGVDGLCEWTKFVAGAIAPLASLTARSIGLAPGKVYTYRCCIEPPYVWGGVWDGPTLLSCAVGQDADVANNGGRSCGFEMSGAGVLYYRRARALSQPSVSLATIRAALT